MLQLEMLDNALSAIGSRIAKLAIPLAGFRSRLLVHSFGVLFIAAFSLKDRELFNPLRNFGDFASTFG